MNIEAEMTTCRGFTPPVQKISGKGEDAVMSTPPILCRLQNIHKAFGDHQVLKGIDVEVKKGEVVAILGPSGSGKTTLLRCINFLERADSGSIEINGLKVDCQHASRKEILKVRRKTAMVFQSYNLFKNKTIIQNVMEGLVQVKKLPKLFAYEESASLLEKVGLHDRLDYYPSQLSGGQQQRAGIARALILNPDVILLDEPTSALDTELVGGVLQVIKAVACTGITMIIVTHEVAFAKEAANKVIFMDGGVIVEEGSPSEVIDNPQNTRTQQFLSRINNLPTAVAV
jgi:L-cystine transport system ATP-binding protein